MTRATNPRAASPDQTPDEPRPTHAPDESDRDDATVPADPDAPGRSLFDEDDDAVEPNEPA